MQEIRLGQLWLFYGMFVIVSVAVDFFRTGPTFLIFFVPSTLAYDLALGLAVAGCTILATEALERWSAAARSLSQVLGKVLGPLRPRDVFWYSLCSSIGEEMLFRGAIQPSLGLVLTSVLFGAIHGFFSRALWLWSSLAVVMGLVFGWLMEHTGSLLAPIIAHFTINAVNLTLITRRHTPREVS